MHSDSVPGPHLHPTPSESLYQLLSQTSPENMHRNVAQYGLDPATRYPNLNLRAVTPNQVRPPLNAHQTSLGQPPSSRSGLPSRPAQSLPLQQAGPFPMGCAGVRSACLKT